VSIFVQPTCKEAVGSAELCAKAFAIKDFTLPAPVDPWTMEVAEVLDGFDTEGFGKKVGHSCIP